MLKYWTLSGVCEGVCVYEGVCVREREREGERVTIRSLFYLLFQRASNIKKKKKKKIE